MTNQSIPSGTVPASSRQSQFGPPHVALIVMGLLATVTLVVMLISGVRTTGQFRVERYILHVAYVGALLWYLVRRGPSVEHLPDIRSFFLRRWEFGRFIPVLVMALILLSTFFGGESITMLLLMIAVLWILVVWRREIRLLPILLGLGVAVIAFLGGLPFWINGFVGTPVFTVLLICVPPMFVAGGLLLERTGLGGSQLYAGRYLKAGKSFLWGCLLFVPLGLFNAAAGSPGTGITWVARPWMPVSLPWFSGITEEVWFRLFLVSLCYFLVRPGFSKRPVLAVAFSVLFSAITFGMGHSGTLLDRFLTTGLLFGLPMAVVFVGRDVEHTIGALYDQYDPMGDGLSGRVMRPNNLPHAKRLSPHVSSCR